MEYSKNRVPELRDGFPQNINRFAFKLAKMCPIVAHDCYGCNPAGLLMQPAFLRTRFPPPPAGAVVLAWLTALVHGAQPMLGYPRSCSALYGTLCAWM